MKKITKIFSLITLIILILIAIFVTWFIVSFSYGSFSGFFYELKPEPNWESNKIMQVRNNTIDEFNSFNKEIKNQMNFNSHGSAFSDICVKCEHNWKISNSCSYTCTYKETYFFSFNSDFRETLLKLHSTIKNFGFGIPWEKDSSSLHYVINEYYDDPQFASRYFGNGSVSNLPNAHYYMGGVGVDLMIDYAQKETTDLSGMEYNIVSHQSSFAETPYEKTDSYDLHESFKKATEQDKYFISLTFKGLYFTD